MRKLYSRKAVLDDVANLAFVVGDVREGEYTAHSLHQTFDICAPGNIDRVNRVLDLAISEVETLLTRSRHPAAKKSDSKAFEKLVCNLMHEYLVARVFYDWLTVAFPPALSANTGRTSSKTADNVIAIWKEKASEARTALESALRTTRQATLTRRIPPI